MSHKVCAAHPHSWDGAHFFLRTITSHAHLLRLPLALCLPPLLHIAQPLLTLAQPRLPFLRSASSRIHTRLHTTDQ